MRTRDLWTLASTMCLFAALGIVFLGHETMAEEVHPEAQKPSTGPTVAVAPERPAPAVVDGMLDGTDGVAAVVATSHEQRVDTTGWTSGIIRGDIQLTVSILDRIKTISIHVEEGRNPVDPTGAYRPQRRFVVPATMGPGTPTFEVRDIPFSEYPWIVTAYAPGLNGSRSTVVLDAEHPLADVVLSITPGAPFTVLLRDQDQTPYTGIDVTLLPVGEPLGRPKKGGTSDNFGSVVFEDVLAGEYKVHASQAGQPLIEPQAIMVQPGNRVVADKIQGQGHTLTIARGMPLQLRVADVRGYGLADALISATATDRSKLTVLEATTDLGGNATFPRLTPGVWQIDVQKTDFQRSTRNVTIKAGEPPDLQEVQLIRLR